MKYALRQLASSPGYTLVALVTLALGIGVNTTAFTVMNRLMLQSLPFHDPSLLVQVWTTENPRRASAGRPRPTILTRGDQNTPHSRTWLPTNGPGESMSYAEIGKPPIQIGALYMTANFFTILGVQPQLGRLPDCG